MKKARAMYIPAGGKQAVWGPVDHNVLPEGYPYKEKGETVIEWDGNTEGKFFFGNEVSGACKVSDEAFDNLAGCPVTLVWNDEVQNLTLSEGTEAAANVFAYSDGVSPTSVLVVSGENDQNLETGTYFFKGSQYNKVMYVSKLTVSTETIHTMAEEFLPALTSPNGTKYQLTVADDGTLSAVAVS